MESCLFESAKDCKIHYPAAWDTESGSFFEKIKNAWIDADETILPALKKVLTAISRLVQRIKISLVCRLANQGDLFFYGKLR